MARPLVLIFQQLAAPTATPNTPDLNTIVVGPAYDLFDYPDDAATILLPSTYGQLQGRAGNGTYTPYSPPVAGSDAVIVLDGGYPGQSPGSRVDHSSVRAYLRTPRVVLGSTYLGAGVAPVFGGAVTTSSADKTLISITGGPTTDFVAAGIQPGDTVILTSSQAANEQTFIGTVQSVGEPDANGQVPPANVGLLRLTSQLPDAGTGANQWTYDAATEIRIERTLVTQELNDPSHAFLVFPEGGSDKVVLKGAVQVIVAITPAATTTVPSPATTLVNRSLSYAELYLAYRALRQDLQDVGSVTSASVTTVSNVPVVVGYGKIDARNPLAVALSIALQNGGTVPIYAFGVATNDAAGHLSARAALASRQDLYCFVPLTQDINIHAAYKVEFDQMADPSFASTNGTIQKFRVCIGSIPLPEIETISNGSISGVAQAPTGVATGKYRTLSITAASTATLNVRSVLPGDSITIGLTPSASDWQSRRGTHKVGHVNSSQNYPNVSDPMSLEIIPSTTRWDDAAGATSGDIELVIKAPDGTVKVSTLAQVDVSTGAGGTLGTVRYTMLNPTAVGGPYTVLYAVNGALTLPAVSIAGFAITVTVNGTSNTHAEVITAVNSHAVVKTLMLASIQAGAANVVAPTSQATRDAITGQTGSAASLVVGAAAGNIRVTGLTGMTAASVGHYMTITGAATPANNGTFLIAVYTSATSVDLVNASAVAGDANNASIGWTERQPYTSIRPIASSAVSTIVVNDDLYNRLEDGTARFLTDLVRPGDTLQIPIDPNNYGPTAFEGRVLSYLIAAVQNENRLLIANGTDDTDQAANELPHFFARDLPDRYIDDATPNAQNYRIVRALSKDDQVLALTTIVQSARSKRLTVVWPDVGMVSDLRDGSLPRAVSSTRTLAGPQPMYYLAAAVGGVVAGVPPQAGLTGGTFIGFGALSHTQGYYSETQLSQLSDGGLFVCIQATPGALPECIHQLTTDTTALETGELSVVKNVDFLSLFFQGIIKPFIGQYNVLPETLNEVFRAVSDGAEELKGRKLARIGAPLISGQVTSISVSPFSADSIELYFTGAVPRPLNRVNFRLVV